MVTFLYVCSSCISCVVLGKQNIFIFLFVISFCSLDVLFLVAVKNACANKFVDSFAALVRSVLYMRKKRVFLWCCATFIKYIWKEKIYFYLLLCKHRLKNDENEDKK